MSNPLLIAGARRRGNRRYSVGAEFVRCPDGSWTNGPVANATTCAGRGWPTPSGGGSPIPTPPGGATGGGYPTPPGGASGGGYPTPSIPIPTIPTPTIPTPTIPGGSSGGGYPGGCAPDCSPCPENLKRYTMPFVPDAGFTATVAAGAQVRFVGKPQKMFKPDRLIIASTIAPYFDVVNLIIANIPQSLSQGNIPADIFSEVSTYTLMTFDQAYPGIDIVIIAQNKSSVSQTFQATLIGDAIG